MATTSTFFRTIHILLAMGMLTLSGNMLAASGQTDATALAKEADKEPNNLQQDKPQQDSGGLLSRIKQTMPNLEQALIIFTSFNGLLIVFGAVALVVKKRMEDDSASTLASIKATQSRIPQEK